MTRSDKIWRLSNPVPRRHGFSLIEVMVTLAIVSVAALGMASLQVVAVRSNNSALLESQAATAAQDLIERIRANPTGNYSTTFEETISVSEVPPCKGVNSNCDAVAMARHDLMDWKCSLGAVAMSSTCATRGIAGQLPNGDGSITVVGNTFTISVLWFDAASNATRTIVITAVI